MRAPRAAVCMIGPASSADTSTARGRASRSRRQRSARESVATAIEAPGTVARSVCSDGYAMPSARASDTAAIAASRASATSGASSRREVRPRYAPPVSRRRHESSTRRDTSPGSLAARIPASPAASSLPNASRCARDHPASRAVPTTDCRTACRPPRGRASRASATARAAGPISAIDGGGEATARDRCPRCGGGRDGGRIRRRCVAQCVLLGSFVASAARSARRSSSARSAARSAASSAGHSPTAWGSPTAASSCATPSRVTRGRRMKRGQSWHVESPTMPYRRDNHARRRATASRHASTSASVAMVCAVGSRATRRYPPRVSYANTPGTSASSALTRSRSCARHSSRAGAPVLCVAGSSTSTNAQASSTTTPALGASTDRRMAPVWWSSSAAY